MKSGMFMGLVAIATVAAVTGCASSGSSKKGGVQEEFALWAEKRAPFETVVSKAEDPAIRKIVDGVAAIPGGVYGFLAKGADAAMARNAGRDIYLAVRRDVEAGTDSDAILAAMSDADKAAFVDYAKFCANQDFGSLRARLEGIAGKLGEGGAKIANAIPEIKNLDSMKGKNPIALARSLAPVSAEIDVVKGQLADCVKACQYWQDLNAQDEQMQKFMKDHPVEK